jgi:hypothetical protein
MVGARPRIFFPIILVSLSVIARGQSFDEPAHALAQKIAAVLKTREPVMFSFSSVAAVNPSDAAAARDAIERQLPGAGISTNPQAGISVAITLSENLRDWVWVAEIHRTDSREVVMEEWPKPEETAKAGSVMIEKRRMLEQDSRILDFAPLGRDLLVLDAESVTLYENSSGAWQRKLGVRVPVSRSLPRDLRGRLFVQGDVYQAYLPGLTCNGNAASGLGITCHDEALWPLGSNARAVSIPMRNYFEHFVLPDGLQKRMPAFFSAAGFSDHGHASWLFAGTDGRMHLYNAAFDPGASWAGWGSDVAAVETECGSRTLLLATAAGDNTAPDSLQAYELKEGAPRPAGDPVSFPGPVTALWSGSERGAAVVVSRDLKSGRYAAFRLSIPCSR